jgi:hypothetical protein
MIGFYFGALVAEQLKVTPTTGASPFFQSLKPLTPKPDWPRTIFRTDSIDKVSLCQLEMAKRLIVPS